MSTLDIQTRTGQKNFRPADEVTGTAMWQLDKPPKSVELRLFWFTRGKGTTDVGVAETVTFDGAGQSDRRDFRVRLPAVPYSFSGKLISVVWALELIAQPGNQSTRFELTMSPTGTEVALPS